MFSMHIKAGSFLATKALSSAFSLLKSKILGLCNPKVQESGLALAVQGSIFNLFNNCAGESSLSSLLVLESGIR